jgi:hypothetical protein
LNANAPRLNTTAGVARLLARVLHGLLDDSMDPAKARTIIYGCGVLLTALSQSDLERRIENLERAGHG